MLDTTTIKTGKGTKLVLSSAPGYPMYYKSTVLNDLQKIERECRPDIILLLLTPQDLHEDYFSWSRIDLLKEYEDRKIDVLHFPIGDFSTPKDMITYHNVIVKILKLLQTKNVLIHCGAGLGRTGTVASGLFIHQGKTPAEALKLLRVYRPGVVETTDQEHFIREYHFLLQESRKTRVPFADLNIKELLKREDAPKKPAPKPYKYAYNWGGTTQYTYPATSQRKSWDPNTGKYSSTTIRNDDDDDDGEWKYDPNTDTYTVGGIKMVWNPITAAFEEVQKPPVNAVGEWQGALASLARRGPEEKERLGNSANLIKNQNLNIPSEKEQDKFISKLLKDLEDKE